MFILTSEEYKHILDVSSTHCLICNNIWDKVSKIMTVGTKLACFVFKREGHNFGRGYCQDVGLLFVM